MAGGHILPASFFLVCVSGVRSVVGRAEEVQTFGNCSCAIESVEEFVHKTEFQYTTVHCIVYV